MFVLRGLTKIYEHRQEPVHALDGVTLEIEQGSFITITGGSGSGKTTLLLTLGGLIHPTAGEVRYRDCSLYSQSENQLARYRSEVVGFVLQTFNLVPYLTALENVMVPMLLQSNSRGGRLKQAEALLSKLGLSRRTDFLPQPVLSRFKAQLDPFPCGAINAAALEGPPQRLSTEVAGIHTGDPAMDSK